jgi:hypothetical protein
MSRPFASLLFLLTLAAAPARADDASGDAATVPASDVRADSGDPKKDAILVNPDAVKAQADELHDAVANPSVDNFSVHSQAAGFFEGLQRETPLVRPAPRVMDRENVDGDVGTVKRFLQDAQSRYDHWKFTSIEVPPPGLEASMGYATDMHGDKRAAFDKTGKMAENQMGEFQYAPGSSDKGRIEINGRMALIATRIGMAFSYATLIHEATHARNHAEGELSPDKVVAGEVAAYKVEYEWLKILDPRAERTIVLLSTLNLYLERHPDDQITRASVSYLHHLLTIWDTGGDEQKLKKMVEDLGYRDGDKEHPGGVDPEARGPRV